MLENRLFDRHHGAIGRYPSPAIASVPDGKSKLRDHDLCSRLVHLNRKIMLQFRRTHVIAHHLADRSPPLRNLHPRLRTKTVSAVGISDLPMAANGESDIPTAETVFVRRR